MYSFAADAAICNNSCAMLACLSSQGLQNLLTTVTVSHVSLGTLPELGARQGVEDPLDNATTLHQALRSASLYRISPKCTCVPCLVMVFG
jgi:hypothetical protein